MIKKRRIMSPSTMKNKKAVAQKTVLEPNAWGGTYNPVTSTWSLLMPVNVKDGDTVPEECLALVGALLRMSSDQAFLEECADWMARQKEH